MEPSTTIFAGGDVVVDGALERRDVHVVEGRIVGVARPGARVAEPSVVVDCDGLVVAPGFIDLQCNGAVGLDITSNPTCIREVARALPRFGVTAFLPTVVTAPPSTRQRAIDAMRSALDRAPAAPPAADGAAALGLHFEGPLISPARLGAHAARFVVDGHELGSEVEQWIESATVRLVTLAPEIPGALDVTRRLHDGGIVVSAGHTEMTPEDLAAAQDAGISWVTHLFNAMAPLGHRSPGSVGGVFADDTIVAGLICDGIHVDPVAVRAAWRAIGAGRVTLVSDASPALGAPYGRFDLGGFEVIHDDTGVRTPEGVLAGSALPLDQAVRNFVDFTGCDLVDAIDAVTAVPADLLGLVDRGRVVASHRADFTVLDHAGHLHATVVGGRCLHGELVAGRSPAAT